MRRRKNVEIFSLYFLDGMCCAFGAVIMLLLITKAAEPRIIEAAKTDAKGLIMALQKELFDIRGETDVLNRDMKSADDQLTGAKGRLASLQGGLTKVKGQFASGKGEEVSSDLEGQLFAARQKLTDEMRTLLADYKRPRDDTTVGGVPVDSEYIIFVIDSSGSMFEGPWKLVIQKISEILKIYPKVKGIQIMTCDGAYMFPDYTDKWIPDSPAVRQQVVNRLATWAAFCDSNPTRGIIKAIERFYEPGKKISIYVFGDDFNGGQAEAVARYVDKVNAADKSGQRLVRIHAVGFVTQASGFRMKFANLMRTLCERNGGTFVALANR